MGDKWTEFPRPKEEPYPNWDTEGAPNDQPIMDNLTRAARWVEQGANGSFGDTSGKVSPGGGAAFGGSSGGPSGGGGAGGEVAILETGTPVE